MRVDLKKYKREKRVLLEKYTSKAMQFNTTLMYPAPLITSHHDKRERERDLSSPS